MDHAHVLALGEADRVRVRVDRRIVDAHDELGAQHGLGMDPGANVFTRDGLGIRGDRILEIDLEERTALVQPGLPNAALDREARGRGCASWATTRRR